MPDVDYFFGVSFFSGFLSIDLVYAPSDCIFVSIGHILIDINDAKFHLISDM